ncbi:MAG: YihY family inner membrane protein [Desulfuromonadales bacterium]|nr:YihY family inner membrane protein [Desulfuromonadales bacterium]NIS41765.1 YihY family inner membrane protein [Desulfuromonadales bacterium]
MMSYVKRDIWEIDVRGLRTGKRLAVRLSQIVSVVLRDFFADQCLVRASALSFTTILAIVPLFALMFSLFKGIGGVESTLQPFLLEKLTLGSPQISEKILQYVENTSAGQLGAVGLGALILSVIALLTNVENSFNHIWGVKGTRPFFRVVAYYSSLVIVGPVFILAAISMTTSLKNQAFVQILLDQPVVGSTIYLVFQVVPYLAMWAVFIFVYLFIPNLKVDLRAAVIGGIFAGTLWLIAQGFYVDLQIGVARYNAIYGTMAALPILLVWIFISWVIVFLGLELTYVFQNLASISREQLGENVDFASRELVALTLLLVVTRKFYAGEKPWSLEKLSETLEIPPRLGRSIANELVDLNLLIEARSSDQDDFGYQPARAPDQVTVFEVLQDLREDGVRFTRRRKRSEFRLVGAIEDKLKEASREVLDEMTLLDLAQSSMEAVTEESEA